MKRLNKKGFTLIELLAIIVILAIILIVTVPTILDSINDARLSSLHSSSKSVANWYDEGYAADQLAFGTNYQPVVGGAVLTTTWQCLNSVADGAGNAVDLFEKFGLNENDVVKAGNIPTTTISESTCSAIRTKNNRTEVLLIAKTGGKFKVGSSFTYALSSEQNGALGVNGATTATIPA